MLNFFIFNYFVNKFFLSGLLFDFWFKKIIEIFLKNILIYTAQFFAEKFLIEYITKKTIELYIFLLNKKNFFFFFNMLNFFFFLFLFIFLFLTIFLFFLI